MEIERKFLVDNIPYNLDQLEYHNIEQAYLCTDPVVRIRKQDQDYYMTYKGKGLMCREEYNLPLNKEAYNHMKEKADGYIISKCRYLIPLSDGLTIELDIFQGVHSQLVLAEVEFESEEAANAFIPPEWFVKEVTTDPKYQNSYLSNNLL